MSTRVETPQDLSPRELRARIRRGEWRKSTVGLAAGYAQANLVVLPRDAAYDFLVFCQRNPKPCPLVEVTDPGNPEPAVTAPGADLRVDVPKYRVHRRGRPVTEEDDIRSYWRDDLVAFLLGCSFTFEGALQRVGIPVRHIDCGRNVPMYVTSTPCRSAGALHGPMVVSMRPLPAAHVPRAVLISGRYTRAHGAPVHIGDPATIGIKDLSRPDYGEPPVIEPGEVPVFWACGVTPQAVAMTAGVEFMITHAPGHMFVTDLLDEDLAGG
ncbi:MAG TPA: putative hydro-lyase [bacterium]|nr:putative hydro-lyase [bacterium]